MSTITATKALEEGGKNQANERAEKDKSTYCVSLQLTHSVYKLLPTCTQK